MSPRRPIAGLAAAALVALYGWRAVEGFRAGFSFEEARTAYLYRDHQRAAPIFDASAVGANRLRATRLAAESRLEQWESQVEHAGSLAGDPELLVAAAKGFLECRCIAPASRRSWEGLGEIYDEMEWRGREARSLEPFDPGRTAWERVGRPGRVSIGMIRGALELAPHWYTLLDDLAVTFWSYGLEVEAREAVRAAALSLPLFDGHRFRRTPGMPEWVPGAFAAASTEAIGKVPLIARADHLTDLGKLAIERGAHEEAVALFRQALELRGDALNRAEIEFHLAVALLALGRNEEGRARLESASQNETFRAVSLRELARAAEREGDLPAAMAHLRRLRQQEPRNLEHCLEFARLARALQDWPAAIEALRWARLIHEEDPRAHLALAEIHLERGELREATAILREIEGKVEAPEAIDRLRRAIAEAERGG